MTRRAWLLAGFAALSACATAPPTSKPSVTPSRRDYDLLEPVLGARAGPDGIILRVRSMGCTAKADFALFVDRGGPVPTVAFGRRRVDACVGPLRPIELTFSYAELGLSPGAPLLVLNPLAPPP